jgi:hypothetical protein
MGLGHSLSIKRLKSILKKGGFLSAFFDSKKNKVWESILIYRNKIYLIISIFSGCLLLSSCQESEQGRILNYKKGVYLGKKDDSLSKDQVYNLKMHASRQRNF